MHLDGDLPQAEFSGIEGEISVHRHSARHLGLGDRSHHAAEFDIARRERHTSADERDRLRQILRAETRAAMQQVGTPSIKHLTPAMVQRA
jgi:hypothetical protein